MLYTVGEMAKLLGVPTSTLRYYDKEGLLPFVERSEGGQRIFKEEDISWLRVIECMKKTGMPLKDIKLFIEMIMEGDHTIPERLEIIKKQRDAVRRQLEDVQNTLDVIEFKCWYYEKANEAVSTSVPKEMSDDELPPRFAEIRRKLQQK